MTADCAKSLNSHGIFHSRAHGEALSFEKGNASPRPSRFDISTSPVLAMSDAEDRKGLAETVVVVHQAMKRAQACGVHPESIILGGVSQGGAAAVSLASQLDQQ